MIFELEQCGVRFDSRMKKVKMLKYEKDGKLTSVFFMDLVFSILVEGAIF